MKNPFCIYFTKTVGRIHYNLQCKYFINRFNNLIDQIVLLDLRTKVL